MISSNLEAMLAKKQKKKNVFTFLLGIRQQQQKKKETSVFHLIFLPLNFYFL